ncbi:MAG: hypothetical protein KAG92_01410, partial [Deltaproteobacteria bacterium]|nr:hypothetical protein [Deltaproteobacteria bacterium]
MDNQTKWLLNYLDNLEDDFKPMEQALDLLDDYIATDYSYESKNKRLREWNPDQIDLYVVVTKIFTGALLNPTGITYQALIGYVSPDIHCEDVLDTAKIAAECIALCYQADLI